MLFIFDSHPVQYKAPVYQELQRLRPDSFKVVYASDCSVRGHHDKHFGQRIAWDTPLMEGYPHMILHNERGVPLRGFRSLTGRGIFTLLKRERPSATLISQFLYVSDLVAFVSCLCLGIPIWIRHETQDEAFLRPPWKTLLRRWSYRLVYRAVSHAFYIGHANREHLIRHGVSPAKMSFSPYCTPPSRAGMDCATKQRERDALRTTLGVAGHETLLLFSGKLIDKKNPGLLLDALAKLTPEERRNFKLLYVGAGTLEPVLRRRASEFSGSVSLAGFINQEALPDYYLAADVLALPSRRAGETWGLVVNEALQAGCAVIVSDAAGCHREFGDWERVRVIPDDDASACAAALLDLTQFPRSFDWCARKIEQYSTAAAARGIAEAIDRLPPPRPAPVRRARPETPCASS